MGTEYPSVFSGVYPFYSGKQQQAQGHDRHAGNKPVYGKMVLAIFLCCRKQFVKRNEYHNTGYQRKATFSIPSIINLIYDAGQIELHCIMLIFIVGMFGIRMKPQSFTEAFSAQKIPFVLQKK